MSIAAPGVLGNDTDADADQLTAILVSAAGHGTLALSEDGSFTYTAEENYTGTDTFSYQASDGQAVSNPASVSINVRPERIFADGFESGDLTAWTASLIGDDLSVSAAAAMIGGSGLQVVINDNIAIYLTDDSPSGEKRYRARFYFDPNAIEMAALDRHNILLGYSTLSQPAMLIELRYVANTGYQLRTGANTDGSGWTLLRVCEHRRRTALYRGGLAGGRRARGQ